MFHTTEYDPASDAADTAPASPPATRRSRRRRTDTAPVSVRTGSGPVTGWAALILAVIFIAMAAVGGAGAYSTYHNMTAALGDSDTAVGLVAAGEGVTGILGLALIGLTLIARPYPLPLRLSLWIIPAIGSGVGVYLAKDDVHRVVYGVTPLAMTCAAELAGYLARSVVVHRTGYDAEADRKTGELLRMIEFHQARAARHPDEATRKKSAEKAWKLAERLGKGDSRLSTALTEGYAVRTTEAALVALDGLYGRTDTAPAVTDAVPIPTAPAAQLPVPPAPAALPAVEPEPVIDEAPEEIESPWWKEPTRPVSVDEEPVPVDAPAPSFDTERPSVEVPGQLPFDTFDVDLDEADTPADTADADRAGADTDTNPGELPAPGSRLSDVELDAVVHMIRTETDPPRSLRGMEERFRELGYVASAARLRAAWDRVTPATADLES